MATRNIATKLALDLAAIAAVCGPASAAQIDHVILGVDDLDRGVKAFEAATGVKPVYGGKHPGGTHNALVSLGEGMYLEILAVQPGVTVEGNYARLKEMKTLTPIGWAVSSKDSAELRSFFAVAKATGSAQVASAFRLFPLQQLIHPIPIRPAQLDLLPIIQRQKILPIRVGS